MVHRNMLRATCHIAIAHCPLHIAHCPLHTSHSHRTLHTPFHSTSQTRTSPPQSQRSTLPYLLPSPRGEYSTASYQPSVKQSPSASARTLRTPWSREDCRVERGCAQPRLRFSWMAETRVLPVTPGYLHPSRWAAFRNRYMDGAAWNGSGLT